jgi:hypothetical protein
MGDGWLSPISIILSIPRKIARATAREPCQLAIDNQEEPAIVEGIDCPKVVHRICHHGSRFAGQMRKQCLSS